MVGVSLSRPGMKILVDVTEESLLLTLFKDNSIDISIGSTHGLMPVPISAKDTGS